MREQKFFSRSTLCFAARLLIVAAADAQKTSFPGKVDEAKSPDGRYLIRDVDRTNQQQAHVLTLIDTKTGKTREIHSYDRHVDVLWSPDSNAVVVNDYEGSDSTRPLLFDLPLTGRKTDLLEELGLFLRKRSEEEIISGNHHVYLIVRRWLSKDELLCNLNGYGEVSRNGLSRLYVYKIGAGFHLYH